jgi:hypothetical protein
MNPNQQMNPNQNQPYSQGGFPQANAQMNPAVNPTQMQPPVAQQVQPAQQPVQQPAPATVKNPNSTQNTLMFQELRDNMMIMGNGTFRAVLACQSVNFDLMSSREREGIEYSYQNFLNALTFPVQIYIRSQKVDIGPYLDKLAKVRDSQDNMLLGVLMDDYIEFIDLLLQEANIMDKSFFVIIPYAPGDENAPLGKDSDTTKGLLTNLFMPSKFHQQMKIPADIYNHAKDEMTRRVSSVINSLGQVGINATRLKTKELGALLYNVYNPDTASRQPIGDFRNYTSLAVRKGEGANVNQMGGF